MIEAYFRQINDGLERILVNEQATMLEAARKIALTIKQNGVVHIFGCGHSHMMAEEVFYRAGGLAPINPILDDSLMLHKDVLRSITLERQEDYGTQIISKYDITEKDTMIIVSTSGRNPVPIDVAITAQKSGCTVIAIISFNYSALKSRHSSGKSLLHFANIAINNHIELGDTVLKHELMSTPFASVSTIHNMSIINAIISQATVLIAESGEEPPIFLSGNIDGSDEHNKALIHLYKDKIPLFQGELS